MVMLLHGRESSAKYCFKTGIGNEPGAEAKRLYKKRIRRFI